MLPTDPTKIDEFNPDHQAAAVEAYRNARAKLPPESDMLPTEAALRWAIRQQVVDAVCAEFHRLAKVFEHDPNAPVMFTTLCAAARYFAREGLSSN